MLVVIIYVLFNLYEKAIESGRCKLYIMNFKVSIRKFERNLIIALNFVFRGKHSIHSHDKVLRDCRQNVKTNIYVLVSSKVNFKPVQNIFYGF